MTFFFFLFFLRLIPLGVATANHTFPLPILPRHLLIPANCLHILPHNTHLLFGLTLFLLPDSSTPTFSHIPTVYPNQLICSLSTMPNFVTELSHPLLYAHCEINLNYSNVVYSFTKATRHGKIRKKWNDISHFNVHMSCTA